LLIACGAAAGISTAFNAPISGTFFAMEIILHNYTTRSLGAVVVSSWTAHLIGKAVVGESPLFTMPHMYAPKLTELPVFLLVGLAAGLVGIVFSRSVPLFARACDWIWRGPEWLRPAVGGILLGGMLLALPQVYGSGYPVLANAIEGHYDLALVLALMVGKIIATSFTLGIGGLGGVFAPALFIGAMAGTAFGLIVGHISAAAAPAAVYGLVGMAAGFASAERAPLTGIVLIYELTRETTLVVPLVLAVAMAAALARLLEARRTETAVREIITAAAVAREIPDPIPITSSPTEAAAALANSPHNLLPVVDGEGHYVGCLSSHDLLEASGSQVRLINGLITHPTTLSPNAELREMLDTLAFQGGAPVLSEAGDLVGWLVYEDLLARMYPS
jgi:CIC family chloride channel protein